MAEQEQQWQSLEERLKNAVDNSLSDIEFLFDMMRAHFEKGKININNLRLELQQYAKLNVFYKLIEIYDPTNKELIEKSRDAIRMYEEQMVNVAKSILDIYEIIERHKKFGEKRAVAPQQGL